MIDKKWLAGFIDGEGCFNFTKCRKTIYPRLLIVNTNLGILLEIKLQYGGDISSRQNGPEHWKIWNCYRATYKTLNKILDDVYPYLKLKKEVAKLCIESLETKDMEIRQELKIKSNLLNFKGIAMVSR
jgi:LAGLIDADG endonuclease